MTEVEKRDGADLGSAPHLEKKSEPEALLYPSSEFPKNAFLIIPTKGAAQALWALKEELRVLGCHYSRSLPYKGWICSFTSKKLTEDFLKSKGVKSFFKEIHDPYLDKSKLEQEADDIWALIDSLEEMQELEEQEILIEEQTLEKETYARDLSHDDPIVIEAGKRLAERKARSDEQQNEINQLRNSATIIEEKASKSESAAPRIRIISLDDFLQAEILPRKTLLSPWLPEAGICMIFAKAGIGKTFLSLSVAYAVASASKLLRCGDHFLWEAAAPQKVMFCDGEMPQGVLQERLQKIARGFTNEPPGKNYFNIITPDLQDGLSGHHGIPDILTLEGQEIIEGALGDAKLLVLDNLSSLCKSGQENDSADIIPLQQWTLRLRKRGVTTLVIHHASKNSHDGRSNFRGTSRQIDVMDTVMSLERPSGYSTEDGCLFEIHYIKNRGFFGAEAEPMEAKLALKGDAFEWSYRKIEKRDYERVIELFLGGMTLQREIAVELRIGLGTVNRHIKKAKEVGDIPRSTL